jgi:asparagine synthase (glutamine-hydrolysing)
MCGITGIIDPAKQTRTEQYSAWLTTMTDAVIHRGPDDFGYNIDAEAGVAFGFRRLAIQDLTPTGAQPMESASRRHVIVFNGEVYNQNELRAELASTGHTFRGSGDTEVLLEGFERWGVAATLRKARGMFGFAVYDRQEGTLTLGRDRFGEKPLYYGFADGLLLFGSELRSLSCHPKWPTAINRAALSLFLQYSYVPSPTTIYEAASKVRPGTFLTFNLRSVGQPLPVEHIYFDPAEVLSQAPRTGSSDELAEELDALLSSVINEQMISDVPLGAFLSGGIDSSTIVSLMQRGGGPAAKTFTIGSDDPNYDESPYAEQVAKHLGTDHTTVIMRPDDVMSIIPDLPNLYDEPFADSSQLPTLLVSRVARRDVTVALSGDAGDELFGGYNRHAFFQRQWPKITKIPQPVRSLAAGLVERSSDSTLAQARHLGRLVPGGVNRQTAQKLRKTAAMLKIKDVDSAYRHLTQVFPAGNSLVIGAPTQHARPTAPASANLSPARAAMFNDTLEYLPDDILVKVDRAAMSTSLETRVPFLDPRVFAFAWSLPDEQRVGSAGLGKVILRNVLAKHVPTEMFERPKAGFGIPLGDWLRGPLKSWASDVLASAPADLLDRQGALDLWRRHLEGDEDQGARVWNLIVASTWLSSHGVS